MWSVTYFVFHLIEVRRVLGGCHQESEPLICSPSFDQTIIPHAKSVGVDVDILERDRIRDHLKSGCSQTGGSPSGPKPLSALDGSRRISPARNDYHQLSHQGHVAHVLSRSQSIPAPATGTPDVIGMGRYSCLSGSSPSHSFSYSSSSEAEP